MSWRFSPPLGALSAVLSGSLSQGPLHRFRRDSRDELTMVSHLPEERVTLFAEHLNASFDVCPKRPASVVQAAFEVGNTAELALELLDVKLLEQISGILACV